MDDDNDGSSRSLVRLDTTTVPTQLYPYTNENCPEIVLLPNVIASTASMYTITDSVVEVNCVTVFS